MTNPEISMTMKPCRLTPLISTCSRSYRVLAALAIGVTVGMTPFAALAQEEAEPLPETVEPLPETAEPLPETAEPLPEKVDALLKKMSDHLAGAKTFVFEANILFDEVLDSGLLAQRAAKLTLLAQRPSGLRAHFKSDTEERTMWYNGTTVNVVDLDDKVHVAVPVPDKIGPALDHLMDHYGISIPLSDFLFENPYEALTSDVDRAHYMGMSQVNGIPCHHLVFSQEAVDWQLWIEDGDRPIPRKLVIVYKNDVGVPHYMATLTGVKLQDPLPDDAFNPEIPEGVTSMDVLDLAPEATSK